MSYDIAKYKGLKTAANAYNSMFPTFNALATAPQLVDNGFSSHFIIGKIIYQALFCEIALKALTVRDNKTYGHIHKLDALFNKLTPATQQLIKDKMTGVNNTNFDSLLTANNNLFVEWRYFFEGGATYNPDFMNNFSIAIRDVLFDSTLE